MNILKRFLAWLRPQKLARYGPDHVEPDLQEEERPRPGHRHRKNRYDMKRRRVNVYNPGPFHRKLTNHPFMRRMKASRLQTLGQKNVRGNYILETDPPSEKELLAHMHSHARWMAMAGAKSEG